MLRALILFVLAVAALPGANRVGAQNAPREAGYLYLSPVPGASYVSPQTRYVLVRFNDVTPAEVTNLTTSFITVNGAGSGLHSGVTHVASDGRTVICEMGTDFSTNELVTITLNPQVGPAGTGNVGPYQYQFMTAVPIIGSLPTPLLLLPQAPALRPAQSTPKEKGPSNGPVKGPPPAAAKALAIPSLLPNGVSVPSDFPKVVITVNTNPSPGYLFLENGLDEVPPYTMMLDNHGLPIWYHRGRMYDFKIQKNGLITWCLSDATGFPAFDQNFNYLKTYLTTNGYLTDSHELKVLADGTYFMIGYQDTSVDMSQYVAGGSTNSDVRETVLQEFTPSGELIFQWRAWDNYDIRDLPSDYSTDFPHMNAIDVDEDGNLLVSTRHLSEITKINRDSGEIIWRLGGVHDSFGFVNDPLNGMSFQHSISALGNGHYMVFDDGNRRSPQVSRAVEYQLDLTNLTATLAWEFRDTPDKYTQWMGSAQRLPTGNTLIDFVLAKYPKAIEVDANGVKRFELSLVPGSDSYRAFRFAWHGVLAAPYLITEPQPDNVTLIFNKFGDTNVAFYRIYGGTSPHPARVLAESATTLKPLYNLQNGLHYFRVTAVSVNGAESPFSNEATVNVNITAPGQNMVQNGDFSAEYSSWSFSTTDSASAAWSIENGASHFYITNGGSALSSIQLLQLSKALVQGNRYVLDFDAWSSQSRYIEAKVAETVSPFFNYSPLITPYLTPNRTHYRYSFTMQQPSDFSASLLFNLGASTADVYLDNVSLFNPPRGDLNLDGRVDLLDLGIFGGNWLKQQIGLPGDFDASGQVDFKDFGILGENWSAGQ